MVFTQSSLITAQSCHNTTSWPQLKVLTNCCMGRIGRTIHHIRRCAHHWRHLLKSRGDGFVDQKAFTCLSWQCRWIWGGIEDNGILGGYFLLKEASDGSPGDDMTRSDVEKIMEDNIRAAVKIAIRVVVKRIIKLMIENAFMVGFDEHEKGVKTQIRNMVQGALIDIFKHSHDHSVEQCC